MAKCDLCLREMNTATGCIDHNVLLEDGSLIEEPSHSPESSHVFHEGDRCTDCGAEPGGTHHAYCDSARKPDGSQILIDALAFCPPHDNPRDIGSEYVFLVVITSDTDEYPTPYRVIAGYNNYDAAEDFIAQEDWADFEIRATRLQTTYDD